MQGTDRQGPRAVVSSADPYIVVSSDGHVGPSLVEQLRPYCSKRCLADFDDYAQRHQAAAQAHLHGQRGPSAGTQSLKDQDAHKLFGAFCELFPDVLKEALSRTVDCEGQKDLNARERHMDDEGIAAEVIFPGGENGQVLPFVGWGLGASGDEGGKELRDEGIRIYNRWLADFVSGNPHRHVGVMLIPIEDVDAAVREMEWGRNHGLTAVNFPAPRRDFPAYNEERYEPFWSACEDLNLPLCTHRGGGELALGLLGPAGMAIQHAEGQWMSRRALWQMIFSGVFERHPGLAFILTEAGTHWLPFTLSDLDSIYTCQANAWLRKELPRSPSEYWAEHCYLSGSFLARFELEMALQGEISPENLMWGADYPHVESTWPDTRAHLRFTFSGAPESVTRRVLGDNAIRVFGLDREQLAQVAEKIGPAVAEVDEPLEQMPERRYLAFRTHGSWG